MGQYQDAKQRALKAQMELEDKSIPPHIKVHNALSAFKGMNLSSIPYRMRMSVESAMVRNQRIFNRYPIKTFVDYQLITEKELNEMIENIASLCRDIMRYK